MFNHFLIVIALLSFSIATTAAAVPMDVGQAALVSTQNADLHKDVAQAQGGNSDKDVANISPAPSQVVPDDTHTVSSVGSLFVAQQETNRVHPLTVLFVSIGLVVLFISRNSSSTK
ncbi:hypothetical protein [Cellvibrio sp. UBA7661]|uniref:hypothetical protein n=1 Tax=Cellvibrio sp. UBA7661 TaxID=1946311 RepID=UPI002F35D786